MSLQEAQEAMKGASISYPAGAFVQVPVRNAVGPLDIAAYHQGLPGALFFKIWGRPPHPQSTLTGLVAHVSYINLAGQQVEGPITFQ